MGAQLSRFATGGRVEATANMDWNAGKPKACGVEAWLFECFFAKKKVPRLKAKPFNQLLTVSPN